MSTRNRVFVWLLNLEEYTIPELAQRSGVNEQTVRSVLKRLKSDVVEEVDEPRGAEKRSPGGQSKRHRLTAHGRDVLRAHLQGQRESLDAVVTSGDSAVVPTNLGLALDVAREALVSLDKLSPPDHRDRDVLLHSAREALTGAHFVLREQQVRFAATPAPAWLSESRTSVNQLNAALEAQSRPPEAEVVHDPSTPVRRWEDRVQAQLFAEMQDAFSRMSSAASAHDDPLTASLEGVRELTAGEMSSQSPHVPSIVFCSPDDTLSQALRSLTDYALEVLPVIDGQTQVGTVRADILGSVLQEPSLLFEPVGSIMSTGDWPVLDVSARMPEILESMRGGVKRALVQREQQLVGVVTAKDVRQNWSAHLLRASAVESVDE